MKVTKIEIKKEIIEIDSPYYKEIELPGLMKTRILKEGEVPQFSEMMGKEIHYEVRQVYNPETKDKNFYAVMVDDDQLFRDLIAVSNGFIKEKIIEEKEKFIKFTVPEVRYSETLRIRRLPWWKKVFNKF